MPNMRYSVLNLADKEQLQQLIHVNQESLQAQQDHQQPSDQHRHVQLVQVQDSADEPMRLQAALEDDAAELTASNWAQQQSAQHSSHSRHHSSGILFAPLSQSYIPSSGSTNSASSASSKHTGFFQVRQRESPGDAVFASTARPRTAGPVPSLPQHTTPGPASADAAQPRTAAGPPDKQKQQWSQFQQHAPDAAAGTATFTRSLSSPESASRLLPTQLQQQPAPLPALGVSSKQPALQHAHGVSPVGSSRLQAAGRLSLDGGSQRLGRSAGMCRSSSGVLTQSANREWQDCAPAGDDSMQMRRSAPSSSLPLPELFACTPQEALLLLRHNQQQQQQLELQSQQHVQAQQELLQRAASTPPFLSAEQQQQYMPASRSSSPCLPVSPRVQAVVAALQQGQLPTAGLDLAGHRPRSPVSAGSWSSQRHSSLSPAGPMAPAATLPPEASAAAAAAAASIQQAMAAVNEEMEQLQLLQVLNKERRRLQAAARAAVARAAAATAASAADYAAAGGLLGTVEARGRQGSLESCAGSHAGNSSSTHSNSGGFSSGSLGADVPSVTGYLGAAVQVGPIAAQQQHLLQQQAEGRYGATSVQAVAGGLRPFISPQRPQRYSETHTGSSSGSRAWGSAQVDGASLAAVAAAMQHSRSLSPKAAWSEAMHNGPSAGDFAARAAAQPGHLRSSTWSGIQFGDHQLQPLPQQQQQQLRSHQVQSADGRAWAGTGGGVHPVGRGLVAGFSQGDVQDEMQQLATEAAYLQQLQQALQSLK